MKFALVIFSSDPEPVIYTDFVSREVAETAGKELTLGTKKRFIIVVQTTVVQ